VYAVAAEASPPASDSEPPTIPAGLTASVKRKQVNLSWQPASDNVGVAGYRVRRDGAVVATVSNPSHVDRGGVAGSVYSVSAFDAAGNESGLSASATAVSGNGNGGSGNGKKPR
jgi:cellulose 1,4-beta-cellobiosidase